MRGATTALAGFCPTILAPFQTYCKRINVAWKGDHTSASSHSLGLNFFAGNSGLPLWVKKGHGARFCSVPDGCFSLRFLMLLYSSK